MMSIGKLSVGAESYYLEEVLAGAEDYYVASGEVPGRWLGAGATALDLDGEVGAEQLRHVLAGLTPDGVAKLRATSASVPGFDLTLSAPKSVSVLWALGDPTIAAKVVESHELAVDAALHYLAAHGCRVRRGRGGVEVVPADGFVAAVFRHRTSRAGDPTLHSHMLVANMAAGPDGRWTALDARQLYREARTTGFVYQAVLRHELGRSLGVCFGDVVNGHAELLGVDDEVCREFSQRSRAIRDEMERRSVGSARGAQLVTLDTRPAKATVVTDAELRSGWQERAEPYGVDLSWVTGWATAEPSNVDDGTIAAAVTENTATYVRRDVVRAVAGASPEGLTLDEIEARTDTYLASVYAIELAEGVFTTPEILELERQTVALAVGSPADAASAWPDAVARAIEARPSLTDEQAAVVEALCGSNRAVDVVIGHAGSGKTFSLDACRAAWQQSGLTVVCCSLSARAAAELESGSGIESSTIDRLLASVGRGRVPLDEWTVVVVDEAGMAGTRRLAALVEVAGQAGAKIVLVGDPAQLPEIDAGGLFRTLADRLGALELTANLRQRDPDERQAVLNLRHGQAAEALCRLDRIGGVVVADNADALRNAMVDDWFAHRSSGHTVLMIAPRWSAVTDLNERAQALLHAEGKLGPAVAATGEVTFHVGDTVLALRNDYRHGLLNGTMATVVGGRSDGGLLVETASGQRLAVPGAYLEAGDLTLGYATTIHKAQGVTCDHNLVLGDDTYSRESGYAALTRGRLSNRTYLVAADPPEHGHGWDRADPFDGFITALEHSSAKTAAIEFADELDLGIDL